VRSVLYGSGAGRAPELRFMAPSADIQVGDILVTSGLDGTYPPGLAVAKVATVDRDTGQMFARITCTPLAGVDRSEHLVVLAKPAAMPARPEEPAESDAAKKSGKGRRKGAGTP
jgi:rod shape-determining protein MreC